MPRWKMLAGKFYFGGRRYVKGDVFEATTEDVRGIRDIVEALDKVEEYRAATEQDIPRKKLLAVHKGFGKWDVMNTATDKAINDHPLTKAEARELVEELEDKEVPHIIPPPRPDVDKLVVEETPNAKKIELNVEDMEAAPDEPAAKETTGDTKAVGGKRGVPPRRRPKLK